ncbi:MAG: pyrroline-5-carboxylate reductase [Actinobacteria bacterium]|nr:pyrroline-5-carboxylate reductase [Actinomycetota bacterium]
MKAFKYKLGIIGCGNMGEAILKGILDSEFLKSVEISAFEINQERKEYISENYHILFSGNLRSLVKNCQYILISVKPQNISSLLDKLRTYFDYRRNVIISIAAGISTSYIVHKLKSSAPVIRIMPNTPAIVKKGMAAISRGIYAAEKDLEFTKKLMESLGNFIIIDEKFQDTATAVSGSGPAYFFLFCKYLVEAAVKNGLSQTTAEMLAVNTMVGAGEMMQKFEMDADHLIKMVASPGGTTEAALNKFIENGLENIVLGAVESAIKRSRELQGILE